MFVEWDAEYQEWVMVIADGKVAPLAATSREDAILEANELAEQLFDEV